MSKETLEDRMQRDILICMRNAQYRRIGREYRGGSCAYCTYHNPTTNIKEPVICGLKSPHPVMILVGSNEDPLMRHYISFYKCKR